MDSGIQTLICDEPTCSCGISSLHHEVFDDPVKLGVVVVASSGQLCEVLAGLWCMVPVQLHHNSPHPATHGQLACL